MDPIDKKINILSPQAQAMIESAKPWYRRLWSTLKAPSATRRRPTAATFKTPEENFKSMKLLSMKFEVDEKGQWWSIERRQDIHTGLILKKRERITD